MRRDDRSGEGVGDGHRDEPEREAGDADQQRDGEEERGLGGGGHARHLGERSPG
jgi:hypothetical protein